MLRLVKKNPSRKEKLFEIWFEVNAVTLYADGRAYVHLVGVDKKADGIVSIAVPKGMKLGDRVKLSR